MNEKVITEIYLLYRHLLGQCWFYKDILDNCENIELPELYETLKSECSMLEATRYFLERGMIAAEKEMTGGNLSA